MARPVVQLDGRTLSCCQVRDVARDAAAAAVTGDARERAQAAARTVAQVAARGQVYGRTTGVGANRDQVVSPADLEGHGLRLLRSHAGGGGPLIAAELSRAMLVVRVNQIAAGGSGVDPGIFGPLRCPEGSPLLGNGCRNWAGSTAALSLSSIARQPRSD